MDIHGIWPQLANSVISQIIMIMYLLQVHNWYFAIHYRGKELTSCSSGTHPLWEGHSTSSAVRATSTSCLNGKQWGGSAWREGGREDLFWNANALCNECKYSTVKASHLSWNKKHNPFYKTSEEGGHYSRGRHTICWLHSYRRAAY